MEDALLEVHLELCLRDPAEHCLALHATAKETGQQVLGRVGHVGQGGDGAWLVDREQVVVVLKLPLLRPLPVYCVPL